MSEEQDNKNLGFIKKVNAVFLNIESIQKSVELFSSEAIKILDKVSRNDIVELKALSFCLDELQEIYNNLNFILQSKEFVKDMAAYEIFVEDKLELMSAKEKLVRDLSLNVEQTYQLVEAKKDELIGIIYSVVQNTRATLNLDKVDNTADLEKPVSIATQNELDKKIDIANIEDSFSCTEATKVLSAKCGKELKELIDSINILSISNEAFIKDIQKELNNKLEANDNIQSASKLETERTISLNGAVSGSAVFDGSSDITIETTSLSSIGSYALVSLKDKLVWKEARISGIKGFRTKIIPAGYYPTNVSKKNENVIASELIEVNLQGQATGRDLSGTWFLQGEAKNNVSGDAIGKTCCLAVRVA